MNVNSELKFVYMVQGRSDLTLDFLNLVGRIPQIIVATWDKPIKSEFVPVQDAHFIPNTTWAEGRNYLLEKALIRYPNSQYYLFSDEDARFEKDFLIAFEKKLIQYSPKIAVPLCGRVKEEQSHSRKKVEHPSGHDQIFQAFHIDVINEGIVVPIDTSFDKRNWWLTCEMQQFLIQSRYFRETLRFNELEVHNSHHTLDSVLENIEFFGSQYTAVKYSKDDLASLRAYIENKYGPQEPYLDTIFQTELQMRFRIRNLRKSHFRKLIRYLLDYRFITALKFAFRILFTVVTNVIYKTFFWKRLLISQLNEKNT